MPKAGALMWFGFRFHETGNNAEDVLIQGPMQRPAWQRAFIKSLCFGQTQSSM